MIKEYEEPATGWFLVKSPVPDVGDLIHVEMKPADEYGNIHIEFVGLTKDGFKALAEVRMSAESAKRFRQQILNSYK